MLKAQLTKHLLSIISDRRLALRLKHDHKTARACGFRRRTPSHGLFTHFRYRLGEETYIKIFNGLTRKLLESGTIIGRVVAVNSTHLKAFSGRAMDNRTGRSDPDARVGRARAHYLETAQDLDKVLNIFIRVNSGGTKLSYSDMLLSIATVQWETRDAREEITKFVDEVNDVGEGFDIDKDLVMKCCLVLSDITDIAFKVDNFNNANMDTIEKKWDDIKKAIRLSVELSSSYGYNWKTLTSNNALIPLAYYIMKSGNPDNFVQSIKYLDERQKMEKWLRYSLIKRVFSGQPDNVLRPTRTLIKNGKGGFPLTEIVNESKSIPNRSLTFSSDDIANLVKTEYGEPHTFSVLALLYPTLNYSNRWHMDHIFPASFFTPSKVRKKGIPDEKAEVYLNNFNYIGNLQLMEGLENTEKLASDFEVWLKKTHSKEDERKEYLKKNFIPSNVDLSFTNFEEFLTERNKMLTTQLKKVLS